MNHHYDIKVRIQHTPKYILQLCYDINQTILCHDVYCVNIICEVVGSTSHYDIDLFSNGTVAPPEIGTLPSNANFLVYLTLNLPY